jgi:hypothetical protein
MTFYVKDLWRRRDSALSNSERRCSAGTRPESFDLPAFCHEPCLIDDTRESVNE